MKPTTLHLGPKIPVRRLLAPLSIPDRSAPQSSGPLDAALLDRFLTCGSNWDCLSVEELTASTATANPIPSSSWLQRLQTVLNQELF